MFQRKFIDRKTLPTTQQLFQSHVPIRTYPSVNRITTIGPENIVLEPCERLIYDFDEVALDVRLLGYLLQDNNARRFICEDALKHSNGAPIAIICAGCQIEDKVPYLRIFITDESWHIELHATDGVENIDHAYQIFYTQRKSHKERLAA